VCKDSYVTLLQLATLSNDSRLFCPRYNQLGGQQCAACCRSPSRLVHMRAVAGSPSLRNVVTPPVAQSKRLSSRTPRWSRWSRRGRHRLNRLVLVVGVQDFPPESSECRRRGRRSSNSNSSRVVEDHQEGVGRGANIPITKHHPKNICPQPTTHTRQQPEHS
jgi:hypothetical protein